MSKVKIMNLENRMSVKNKLFSNLYTKIIIRIKIMFYEKITKIY